MSRSIPEVLRLEVAKRSQYRCEYCCVPERMLATTFHVDHIRSLKHDGNTELDNLAFACPHCNQNKGSDVATFLDENNDETVRLFNPRKDGWNQHFEVNSGEIIPKTAIGAATIKILEINQVERIIFRKALIEAGLYQIS
ncbi:MAG: HNH endonuclease [Saprospiraceae bacterium]